MGYLNYCSTKFVYMVIIGAGVGGHRAALHAIEKGLKTAIIEGDVMGGTCVNRGCVPSKALLAVSGRMCELQNEHHMKVLGLQTLSTATINMDGYSSSSSSYFLSLVLFEVCRLSKRPSSMLIKDYRMLLVSAKVGSLLKASCGNATELILGIFALPNHGIDLVKYFPLGSILSNMLLVIGTSLVVELPI